MKACALRVELTSVLSIDLDENALVLLSQPSKPHEEGACWMCV